MGYAIKKISLSVVLSLTCVSLFAQNADEASATEGRQELADLYIVDCLLPGQVRQLGRRTFLTPRRPARLTAAECRLRGGEYVAYDRADYQSALNVWLPKAKEGDPEAQTYVGEIFEKGLGTSPDYELAAVWYKRAADQGYSRAQFNLGTLYELGQGVEQDKLAALNLYRRAWGMSEDDLLFASLARKEQKRLRQQLQEQIRERDTQIRLLKEQLSDREKQLKDTAGQTSDTQAEIESLQAWIGRLESERGARTNKLAALPRLREPEPGDNEPLERLAEVNPARYKDINFGRFYALVIGIQDYDILDDLETPRSDAAEVAEILEDKYGFSVQLLMDVDQDTVMRAVVEMNEVLEENDNLLIYYAGHGNLAEYGELQTGYWLPRDAEHAPRNTYWVDNTFVTQHLSISKARRILVVADSCYAGLLSTDPAMVITEEQNDLPAAFLEKIVDKPARMVLSSGGERPVLDGGGGEHSVFAKAFIEHLKDNEGILSVPTLYSRIAADIRGSRAANEISQEPQLRTIKSAGHALGQFFFVPNGG